MNKKGITEEEFVITFTYEIINDKYISIAGSGENLLFGDWISTKIDDNKMTMKNELGTKNERKEETIQENLLRCEILLLALNENIKD